MSELTEQQVMNYLNAIGAERAKALLLAAVEQHPEPERSEMIASIEEKFSNL